MLGNTENVSSDTIIADENKNVNTSEEIVATPTLTDKCGLHETTHTKTGEALWVISLNDRITSDEYKALSAAVKKVGGYYSRFGKTPEGKTLPGFVFKSEPGSDVIKTINDFFDSAKTQKADETNAIEHADETAADVQKDIPQLQKNYEKAVEEVAVDDEATARAKLENRTAIQITEHATEKAMLAGTLDKGLENYKADRITLNEVQDIREDERSGAKTKYYNLTAEHKIKPVRFEDVQTDSKSFVGFYRNKTTGNVRAVMQTSSTTDKYGNVTNNYKFVGQVKNDYIAQNRFYGNWSEIEPSQAERLWNEELSKLPEFRKENLHLISGVVLQVWDKLPTENVRIYRVLTSDGEMLIGRVVSEDMIDETLRRLGSSRTKEKISIKDLISGIKNGDTVYLDNGWKIVQRKVSGENRIEIVGPSYEHYDLLTKKVCLQKGYNIIQDILSRQMLTQNK